MIFRELLLGMLPLLAVLMFPTAYSQQWTIPIVSVTNKDGICPGAVSENGIQIIRNKIINILSLVVVPECGVGLWYRIAYLNMTDPSQQCPPTWRKYNNQFRACGRLVSDNANCSASTYSTNHQYSKVCGRVFAIQVASPDGFHSNQSLGIDNSYIDGVSITYGSPRNHIWSFVGSYSELANGGNACPCDSSLGNPPQPFVGSNYFCESGNPTLDWAGRVFPNDKLWDGEQCRNEGTCCAGANTPPWFSVDLRSPTSDDIEVRICGTENTENEDTPIELLEIYVQ